MLRKHSVSIRGHRTSFSIEDEFYSDLVEITKSGNMPLAKLISEIDASRKPGENLSSAIRLFVLKSLKQSRSNWAGTAFPDFR